jgi:hypothetical protein
MSGPSRMLSAFLFLILVGCGQNERFVSTPSRFERLTHLHTSAGKDVQTSGVWAGKCIASDAPSKLWGAALVVGRGNNVILLGSVQQPNVDYLAKPLAEISDGADEVIAAESRGEKSAGLFRSDELSLRLGTTAGGAYALLGKKTGTPNIVCALTRDKVTPNVADERRAEKNLTFWMNLR